ncbi:MAG: hypothetical protein JSU63_16910 [Phycisphaerales bacterium]|nr:MAG: hypothetical protein JSU63_16910 [Phycisphaerales bacterium]
MARAQFQGIGAITVWMIVFVALWLTATVFLVIFYTGHEELVSENQRLATANDKLISQAEQSSITLIGNARPSKQGGPTVVGILEGNRADTAFLASGNEADDAATIRAKRDQLVQIIQDDGFVPDPDSYFDLSFYEGMSTLYEGFKAENALRRAAEDRAAELDTRVASLIELNETQKSDFDARAKEFADDLVRIQEERDTSIAQRDAAVAELQREFEERRVQADAELTRERQDKATLEGNLAELRDRFRAQQQRFGGVLAGPDDLATAREPDGYVLTAIPGDEVVYIDLGREDNLTLGLQFSVYSSRLGIPADGQAKAQIEVVSISRSSAECKIVRLGENELVLEGDLVANPVFDPSRQLSFVVIGEFDLDYDGMSDPTGTAVVDAMVTGWGGAVTTDLTALTDFVILGGAPARPRAIGEASREQTERFEATQRAWENYHAAVATARSLSVPIMTQEVFLNFLGF